MIFMLVESRLLDIRESVDSLCRDDADMSSSSALYSPNQMPKDHDFYMRRPYFRV